MDDTCYSGAEFSGGKMSEVEAPKATHLEGGNYFDDIRIDIQKSILDQDLWLRETKKRTVRQNALLNYLCLSGYVLAKKIRLHDFMVFSGLKRQWFEEFRDYWVHSLAGRPVEVPDFLQLQFLYRTRLQDAHELSWNNPDEHLANWQTPANIGATFNFVRKYALRPLASRHLHKILKRGMRILEYGCGVAPLYRTYRNFWNHIEAQWVLADIPNFPFHYARHVYGEDKGVDFACITEDLFGDPLKGISGGFDLISIQEVFEHLDHPRFIAEYLIQRLNKGGLFYFDYINPGTPEGHDTPGGASERIETLEYLRAQLDIYVGDFQVGEKSVGLCIGRKK